MSGRQKNKTKQICPRRKCHGIRKRRSRKKKREREKKKKKKKKVKKMAVGTGMGGRKQKTRLQAKMLVDVLINFDLYPCLVLESICV